MRERIAFDISSRAIIKVLIAAAMVWAWLQLWHFVMVIFVSIVLAIALNPAVHWLEQRHLSRSIGAFVVMGLLAAVCGALIAASWVTIRNESQLIIERLTEFSNQVRSSVPMVGYVFPQDPQASAAGIGEFAFGVARSASAAVGMIIVALVLTVYLLVEWKRTLEWVLAFVAETHRPKVRRTLDEAQDIVFRYAVGSAIASVITGIVTYAVLASLNVPAALLLALLSGLLNFIPIIGFLLSALLASVLAAAVSTKVLLVVIAFYLLFNLVESYYIAPKVFGHELELSNLAVLLAVIVGAELAGVMGALLALPIAALYPTIERMWLRNQLGPDTVDRHRRLSA
jgi:predicted PurR-regulated permease PerM